jgi:hypothetical protein
VLTDSFDTDTPVLVTGGGGFIGGHLVADLVRQGFSDLRAVDVKPVDEWYQRFDGVDSRQLDLQLLEACREASQGRRLVFNLAADMGGMGFIELHKAECMLSVLTSTHMLIAGACALIVGLGGAMLGSFSAQYPDFVSADPFRLVGGVIAALGFIGAGTIFRRDGKQVEGLTTAAAMLFSGGVGVCAALQQWWIAIGATVLALLALRGALLLERHLLKSNRASNRSQA